MTATLGFPKYKLPLQKDVETSSTVLSSKLQFPDHCRTRLSASPEYYFCIPIWRCAQRQAKSCNSLHTYRTLLPSHRTVLHEETPIRLYRHGPLLVSGRLLGTSSLALVSIFLSILFISTRHKFINHPNGLRCI